MTVPRSEWADLPTTEWTDTLETLHLWTQVVGKIRMVRSPWLNHSWSVPLYVWPRGLRTSLVPYGSAAFELAFDFLGDQLTLQTTAGDERTLALRRRTVADFYGAVTRSTPPRTRSPTPSRSRTTTATTSTSPSTRGPSGGHWSTPSA
jgi:hypothetical protein